jgi:RNA polymerase sigma-70 factor, ECF subfamily
MIGTLGKQTGQYTGQPLPGTNNRPEVNIDVLVLLVQNGQTEAFGLLYEKFLGRIYNYLYLRTGHSGQAEDMTQEVFLRAFQNIRNYRYRGIPFLSWLLRIAHNLIVDFYRKEGKKQFVPLSDDWTSSSENPLTIAEHNLDMIKVRKAMVGLPPAQQEAFSLRFVAGLSVSETAEVMGKSEGAVKTLQHEAVVKLRRMMREE